MTTLTVRQAAAHLGISEARLRHLIADGRLPARLRRRPRPHLVIREADLAVAAARRPGRPVTTGAGLRRKDRRGQGRSE